MTTNQTIDGVLVPRELLSYWAECLESAGFKDRPAEMRALLDKEVSGDSRAPQHQGEPRAYDIESAARTLSECMDYSWGHMPEQGRAAMREYVALIIASALPGNAEQPAPVAVATTCCGSCPGGCVYGLKA